MIEKLEEIAALLRDDDTVGARRVALLQHEAATGRDRLEERRIFQAIDVLLSSGYFPYAQREQALVIVEALIRVKREEASSD